MALSGFTIFCDMPEDVVRADPGSRRRALAILLFFTALGAAAIQWGLPWLTHVRSTTPGARRAICISFIGVLVLFGGSVIAVGRRIRRLGRATMEHQEIPPPGLRLLRDVRRVTGARAALIGRGYILIGTVLIACAIGLIGLGTYALVLLWPR